MKGGIPNGEEGSEGREEEGGEEAVSFSTFEKRGRDRPLFSCTRQGVIETPSQIRTR